MRICLPPRFGKTFSLSVIAEFFNVVTVHDVPKSAGTNNLDVALAEARTRRRAIFSGSLLEQSDTDGDEGGDGLFFDEHFANHPVVRIDFKGVAGSLVGYFYESIVSALLESADYWINAYRDRELVKPDAHDAALVFKALDSFLTAQHQSRYIVLIDNYDTPLKAILGKTWHEKAQSQYTSVLSVILRSNPNLLFGLLVGVNEFSLAECDSGVSNIAHIEMTTGWFNLTPENLRHRPADQDEDGVASLFAFSREEVVQLVGRARESYKYVRAHTQDAIMDAITTWYCGYDFGFEGRRYNPLSVMSFLVHLAQAPRDLVGCPFWEEAGSKQRVEDLARSHRADILLLATRLVVGLDSGAEHTGLRVVDMCGNYWAAPRNDNAVDIVIGESTYADSSGNIACFDSLVTMMLHLGYVTIGVGNMVRIPNKELRATWSRLRVLAAFGTMDPSEVACTKRRLVSDLYQGDVRGLLGIRTIIEKLPNSANQYREGHQVGVLGAFLLTMLSGSGRGDTVGQPDFVPEREGGDGNVDLVATFQPSGRLPGGLVVLFKYKLVDIRLRGGRNELLTETRKGLAQIVDHNNAAPFGNYARRLDISI
ncbi:hypothetical protein IWQ56_003604, partial [Coemansia nantahalensis]